MDPQSSSSSSPARTAMYAMKVVHVHEKKRELWYCSAAAIVNRQSAINDTIPLRSIQKRLRIHNIIEMGPPPVSREALLQLYKQLLRSCQTYPSKKRAEIYQAIREEWRHNKSLQDQSQLTRQINVAYKGLSQLRQFDVETMTKGKLQSANWEVQLEQNPMPKPPGYDERKTKES